MAQEITTKSVLPKGTIKPNDPVTVHATAKAGEFMAEGAPWEVHAALAEKLIASGKATAELQKRK